VIKIEERKNNEINVFEISKTAKPAPIREPPKCIDPAHLTKSTEKYFSYLI
jgi:hypothetical protein